MRVAAELVNNNESNKTFTVLKEEQITKIMTACMYSNLRNWSKQEKWKISC